MNVEGAFQHILDDLYAFIATAIAGLVVLLTGFARADAARGDGRGSLMLKAGLIGESGRPLSTGPSTTNRATAVPQQPREPHASDRDVRGRRTAGIPGSSTARVSTQRLAAD
ncbi:hypothetical protein GCM10011594_31560 [Nakamurella endophytica]|uniref:Uncharacterized protein n=1 Tax=Nakamurella endophytica TaxID=1748367 RepID=A0A917T3W0_9ACTN|nr:hypothetical protein GCM10011594_31560 [Nakamurella endophytica]